MRECAFIDLLVDCLRFPFSKGGFNNEGRLGFSHMPLYSYDELREDDPIYEICRLIYTLLKYCVDSNDENK